MPLISVIVPVYNARNFLDRCIPSILEQSFSDFEVIFVDDGSTDRSADVIGRFARNDSRIVLETHATNSGPGAARNSGIARARADLLTFVDSDDFIDANLLQRLYAASEGGRFDIVESGCRAIDENDDIIWEYTPTPARVSVLESVKEGIFLLREWGVHQKLWNKRLFTQNDIRFPCGIFWEDIAAIPILVVCARNLAKIDFVGYNYTQHPASITNTRSAKHVANLFSAHEYFRRFLLTRGTYSRHAGSLAKSVANTVNYFSEHMKSRNRSNPELSERLVRLCQILASQYIADRTVFEHLSPTQLEKSTEQALGLDFNQTDMILRSKITGILEAHRVKEE
jgi:glycosyltransferase involved in cell wall biosynthesis